MASSLWRRQFGGWGIGGRLLIDMAKNALPPTAALIVTQSSTLGKDFDIVGYLPVIVTILESPSLPRVVFLKQMVFTSFLNCIMLCVCLLAAFSVTQARIHTTPPHGNLSEYNSSAAAVSGIWIFLTVWILHTFRVYRPQFTVSIIVCTIFTEVSIATGSRLGDMASHIRFNLQLLEMFFLAHGLSTFVNLFIFPTTSRDVAFTDIKKYLTSAGEVLLAETAYVASLERSPLLDPFVQDKDRKVNQSQHIAENLRISEQEDNAEYKALKASVSSLSQIHGKLRSNIALAKQDVGYSRISADDLEDFLQCFRRLILPLRGMTVLMSIFRRICETRERGIFNDTPSNLYADTISRDSRIELVRQEWKSIFHDFRRPVDDISRIMQEGIRHVSLSLGLEDPSPFQRLYSRPKPVSKRADTDVRVEAERLAMPGAPDFKAHLENHIEKFHARRGTNLAKWLERRDIDSTKLHYKDPGQPCRPDSSEQDVEDTNREQFFVILYMQYLFHDLSDAVLDLVRLADKVAGAQKRFMFPNSRRLKKLVLNFLKEQQKPEDMTTHPIDDTVMNQTLSQESYTLNQARGSRPVGTQRTALGDMASTALDILGSSQSFFGFRVSCAVLSVVIVGLLARTQKWFFNQRGLFCVVFIPFTMAPSSGETLALFVFRVIGTAIAVGVAIVNWYIAYGHAAGVIAFFFIFTFIEQYFFIQYPQYGGVWKGSLITRAIIIGYTLQTQFRHTPQPPATENNHYPVYLIGPYRYACAVIGMLSAFIWTVFPRIFSARFLLRQRLSESIFLLALYYTCMHSTVSLWMSGEQGDVNDKRSPVRQLTKIRNKLFAQQIALLATIKNHARFSRFEPSMGNNFPAELYGTITNEIDLIISYMNLVIHAATSGEHDHKKREKAWSDELAIAFRATTFTASSMTSLLSLLSASLKEERPLPPGLVPPQTFRLTNQLQRASAELMSLQHAHEPWYSAFAVMEISIAMITESLRRILQHEKQLVGVMDFGITLEMDEKPFKKK